MNQVKADVASKEESITADDKTTLEGPMRLKRVWQGDIKKEDWKWPIYDQWRSVETGSVERKLRATKADEDKPDEAPFELTYEQDGPMPDMVTITLCSPSLIQMAKQCLPQNEQYFSIEKPKIDAKDMFIALQAFKDAHQLIQQDTNATETQKWHSKHLLRFLETHFKDTTAEVQRMGREMKVRFDLLWAFLYKGERVYYICHLTGQILQGIVTLAYFKHNRRRSEKRFKVNLECRVYNGFKYVTSSVKFPVNEFKSKKFFDSIGICSMRLLEQSEKAEMEAMFLCNGRKFHDIVTQRSIYMQYEGPRLRYENLGKGLQLKKQKADGRVMVDLLSFASTNPDYELDTARPPTIRNAQGVQYCRDEEMPSNEELMLAPAVVYGFSFSNKLWGGFGINGFSAIHFDDQAFDRDLVLTDQDRKDMLMSLVKQYVSADDIPPQIDPISNKGDGCIFLCYGPPGTGKTLTAESIAEKLHCPLWSVSVFELGVTVNDLEKNLMKILDIASQWRAVLLLDEADVYLEKRTTNADPNRTAMTAIFLRVLEYYRGVLFLTTNRVAAFDDAFCSRISMFLRFHKLSCTQRESIWRNLLSRAQVENPDLALLRDFQLNGREIRNCIRIAQTWAKSSKTELTTDHVLKVVKMLGEFREDLDDAILEETNERSISRALGRVQSMRAANTANGTI